MGGCSVEIDDNGSFNIMIGVTDPRRGQRVRNALRR
jgi:hypothetical protein